MTNLVKINSNNQVTTDSRMLAKVFGKVHSHVMRDIQKLDIPDDFRESNFGLSSYHAGTRNYPMYEITRDGFTLLAMGFTGKKAMKFKIKYIEAFNEMERVLSGMLPDKVIEVQSYTRSLPSGKKEIVLSEKAKEEIGGIFKSCMPNILKTEFRERRIAVEGIDRIIEVEQKKAKEARIYDYKLSEEEKMIIEHLRKKEAEIPLKYLFAIAAWNCAEPKK